MGLEVGLLCHQVRDAFELTVRGNTNELVTDFCYCRRQQRLSRDQLDLDMPLSASAVTQTCRSGSTSAYGSAGSTDRHGKCNHYDLTGIGCRQSQTSFAHAVDAQ